MVSRVLPTLRPLQISPPDLQNLHLRVTPHRHQWPRLRPWQLSNRQYHCPHRMSLSTRFLRILNIPNRHPRLKHLPDESGNPPQCPPHPTLLDLQAHVLLSNLDEDPPIVSQDAVIRADGRLEHSGSGLPRNVQWKPAGEFAASWFCMGLCQGPPFFGNQHQNKLFVFCVDSCFFLCYASCCW